ncbi:DmsC/YnfH family molybdoenzyme membrane anchor subunit [Ramlibacter alkalitolerans]|uniref:Dimethyl sulfoxide reductase anchor subunit n=1 Tax=Ramlibacter alkalitolerans TaxID=2039631 RepID=A0ABS1JHG7_9BURK|nr:DmsC/YnfH family molybdoenzyme membrane anchor subunit [Ramlibacter alkalitolerans]MBL0423637.1 dimethyl sulfoxide reductase anchor subunit [Ramlibacter alkalitolerans]
MNSRHFQRPQAHWDWRAAGNFICGGAGAALALVATLCAPAALFLPLVLTGMALVGLGLFFVWLEIGRPLRAANVIVHLRTSWMSREALAAIALFLLGAGLVAGLRSPAWAIALTAAAFLYCQARLLGAARGIPTWRHPLTVPLLLVTGLTEGLGLYWLLAAWAHPPLVQALPLAALLLARALLWRLWRVRLGSDAAPQALRAIDANAPVVRWAGIALPLAGLALATLTASAPAFQATLLALAGLLATAAGWSLKFTLVTRTGYQHGFSLPRMPVRGVARNAPVKE